MSTATERIRKRRDGLTIMVDLLNSMNQPIKLTHILYRTNLGYSQLRKYMDLLLNMGLVQERSEPNHSFVITDKGRIFVELITSHSESSNPEFPLMRTWLK
jgi:predicted transcriptional regulator